MSGSLPFDHESQKETIRMTINEPLVFDLPCWNKVSQSGKDLIAGLLIKDANKRFTLAQALAHPWLDPSTMK
jgi:serine/threonine protein kinase